MSWTSPAEIVSQVSKAWESGRLLEARLGGRALYPWALRIARPDNRALLERFDDVRAWIGELERESKGARCFGYEIEWEEINHRQLGRNRVPRRVVLPTEDDALRLIGKVRHADRAAALAGRVTAAFPALGPWLVERPLRILGHNEEWDRILAVLAWFRDHPRCGLYIRQLDVPGVDTKFIETRRSLLAELLDVVLPPEAIDASAVGTRAFERRYGLRARSPLVRLRILDRRRTITGLSDLSLPIEQFATLAPAVSRVFITENEINGLAFPDVPDSLVVFGLGYAVDRLQEVAWLADKAIHYWGDIDTHGFAILNRLRATHPAARSLLMDRETLLEHRPLWVTETDRYDGALLRLTEAERTLYEELGQDVLGEHVRLEQERIAFGRVQGALAPFR